MNDIKLLRNHFRLSSETRSDNIEKVFCEIANLLFKSFAIKKGDELYLFADIEFYFYNKHHKDIITHPRNCEATQWYVNDFGGIDLTFKSVTNIEKIMDNKNKVVIKPVLTEESFFGGILIRELRNAETGERLEGPWACAEIFRTHDATGAINDYPVLVPYESNQEFTSPSPRHNLKRSNQSTENKVKYLLSSYANRFTEEEIAELSKEFDTYHKCNYRYRAI